MSAQGHTPKADRPGASSRFDWWTIPFWSGAIVLAGIVGWLLSVLMIPPRRPIEA